ncbi:hypothetical protein MNB_SV-4-818 [hydrothermal vent metagenome]|uniref:Uncharacterized protein n=1 Tax=hydrothermal vent metagenome TaxID=652676 RepID=A0A1W1E964_9ZZZZ
MQQRSAFTLIEVLIAIALMGIILPVLYSSIDTLQDSNRQLHRHLTESRQHARAMRMLYLDIAGSDGNLTIRKNDFDRLCIERTTNSLYGLYFPKVCWVVLKENKTLVRVEGVNYHLPLRSDEQVATDAVAVHLTHFNVQWQKGNVLVSLQQKGKKAVQFLVQGISKPKRAKKRAKARQGSADTSKK